jgi:hypothetical protein
MNKADCNWKSSDLHTERRKLLGFGNSQREGVTGKGLCVQCVFDRRNNHIVEWLRV